jgi:NTP pyrophosphatase (non-canonical NTP hydrolase)
MSNNQIDLTKYTQFVEAVTSNPSNHFHIFQQRCEELNSQNGENVTGPSVNIPLLLTACLGLAAESGEFIEINKKIFFQGKPLNDENVYHLKRELGDIIWYWINACRALGYDPNEVIAENVKKLEARYPGGHFDASHSENRKEGDL